MSVMLTIKQLEDLLERAINLAEYHDMRNMLFVSISQLPNGRSQLEFEQPCEYPECNSTYFRFTNKA